MLCYRLKLVLEIIEGQGPLLYVGAPHASTRSACGRSAFAHPLSSGVAGEHRPNFFEHIRIVLAGHHFQKK
jgi:hypothetical protein